MRQCLWGLREFVGLSFSLGSAYKPLCWASFPIASLSSLLCSASGGAGLQTVAPGLLFPDWVQPTEALAGDQRKEQRQVREFLFHFSLDP